MNKHFDHRNESRDNNDVAGDSYCVGNKSSDQGNNHIRANKNGSSGESHSQCVYYRFACSERRTGSENKHEYGIFEEKTF